MSRTLLAIGAVGLALVALLPWPLVFYNGLALPPAGVAVLTGLSILGAAFLLSWSVEAIEGDVPPVAALSVLALIGLLPEYAVDATFAWDAATKPEEAEYVLANMTGGNRIMLGFGWPLVVLLAVVRWRSQVVELPAGASVQFVALLAASLYGFVPWFFGRLSLIDVGVMLSLYLITIVLMVRSPSQEIGGAPAVGPAALFERLPTAPRWVAVVTMLGVSAGSIFLAADAFADSLVQTGLETGIDEYLLVQWVAPVASEAPELLVAVLLVLGGHASKGLVLLLSAKVNQWMLLAGTMPLLTTIAAGEPRSLALSERQATELLLTLCFSLFGLALLAHRRLGVGAAIALFALYIGQLVMPDIGWRWSFAVGSALLAINVLAMDPKRRRGLAQTLREGLGIGGTPQVKG